MLVDGLARPASTVSRCRRASEGATRRRGRLGQSFG